MHDFEVFHARPIPSHGGSIRVYAACRGSHPVQESVRRMLALEPRGYCAIWTMVPASFVEQIRRIWMLRAVEHRPVILGCTNLQLTRRVSRGLF
jgi:hypothetical protein